jgi:methylenetetrahydrofolate reductase (NADPH)
MSISLEFFPPNDGNYKRLIDAYNKLSFLGPAFVSVTYGALGNAQNKSYDLISVLNKNKINTAAHLTLANKSIKEIEKIVKKYKKNGIKKIVALRGDCPNSVYKEHPEGFSSTSEFVYFLVKKGLEVCVSSYPEPHPDSENFENDLSLLKDKQNAGASSAITQFCFSKDAYSRLLDESCKKGIDIEITPGIMPIYNIDNILNMSQRCGIKIPDSVRDRFGDNKNDNFKQALEICHEQVDYLNELGYKSLHFYTLNRYKFIKQLFADRPYI